MPVPAKVKTKETYIYKVSLADNKSTEMVKKIWAEIGARTGYKFEVQNLPGERSLTSVNNGEMDIEHARLGTLELSSYPHLLKINEYMYSMKLQVFSLKENAQRHHYNSWDDLLNKKTSICFLRGYKSIEQALPKKSTTLIIVSVNNLEQCIEMLKLRRVDLVLSVSSLPIQLIQKQLGRDAPEIQEVGTLTESNYYPFLHEKNRAIIPEISKAILELRKENFFEKVIKERDEKLLKTFNH